MTNLNTRQRVGLRAVQALVHSAGYDPKVISRTAWNNMQIGMTPKAAHDAAINHFLNHTAPELGQEAERLVRLVQHSDDNTVTTYDRALDQYNQTGDKSSIDALAPMIARDSLSLAVRMGEITAEEARTDAGIEAALGYAPSPELREAMTQPAAPAHKFQFSPAQATPPSPASSRLAQNDGPFNLGESLHQQAVHSWINGTQSGPGPAPQSDQAMSSAKHYMTPQRTATGGIRAGMSEDKARSWAGIPVAAFSEAAIQ